MKLNCKNLIPLLIGLLISQFAFSQEYYIQVLDQKSKEAVMYAHAEITDLETGQKSYQVTDDYGKILNTSTSKSIIQISFVGYAKLTDTIGPKKDYKLLLNPLTHNLEEVVVTGQYAPERTDKSIYQIEVIDNKQILAKASQNLQDVLSSTLNFRFSNSGALGTRTLLQGIGGENIKILIDGVPQVGRLNGDLDLGQIDLNNVQRIEIVEGPMSVQYGTNALAGVINVITKDYIQRRFSTKINTYYESVGQYNIDGSIGYSKNKKTYLLNLSRKYFDGFSSNDTSRVDEWKPKQSYSADFRYKRRIGTANLRFQTAYFNEKLLDKGFPQYVANTEAHAYLPIARDGYFYTQRIKSNLAFTGVVGKDNYLDLLAAYTHYNRKKEYMINDLYNQSKTRSIEPADTDTTQINSWVFRGTWSKYGEEERKFNFQVGYDINLESTTGRKIEDKAKAINDYSVFASVKYRPWEWVDFQPGIRATHNTEYQAPLTPSINLKFIPSKSGDLIIRTSYANGFRAPSIKELYLEFVDVNHNIFGNPNLKAETSQSYRVNITYTHNNSEKVIFKAEPSFFYNDIHNKISLVSILDKENPAASRYMYNNIDRFRSLGASLNFTYLLHKDFNLNLGASLTGLNQQFKGEAKNNKFYFYPEANFNASYSILPIRTEVTLNYKYTGEVQSTAIDPNGVFEEFKQEDYHTLDLSAKRSFFDNSLSVTMGGKNLFNVTSITGANQVGGTHLGGTGQVPIMWGRTFFAAVSYQFNR